MRFLLTNDDGIGAPGLEALEQAFRELGELIVVAPHQHLSGCSHRVTTDRPLRLEKLPCGRYTLDGTPADCTRVGLMHLESDVDWVIAGINDGGNLGADIYMSGTVAAVREAALLGKPGIAVSQYRRRGAQVDWQRAARWTRQVVEQLLAHCTTAGSYWNVNLPDHDYPVSDAPSVAYCPVDPHPLPIAFRAHEGGLQYDGRYEQRKRKAFSDVSCCFSGAITVSELWLAR